MYERLNLANGQVLDASHLKHIEDGIVEAATTGGTSGGSSRACARNLLDNSDFTNPVNQRGSTDYTSGYGIDRWIAIGKNSRWSIVNGGLEVCTADATAQPYIDQRIPVEKVSYTADAGKKYTVAAKIDGLIYLVIATVGGTANEVSTPFGTMALLYSTGASCMVARFNLLKTEKHVIEWVALYEGEYTAETLPEYQPKGYGAELAECQRYYCNSWFGSNNDKSTQYQIIGQVFISGDASSADFPIYFPQTMRVNPTMVFYGSGGRENPSVYNNGYFEISSVHANNRLGLNGTYARAAKGKNDISTWTVGSVIQFHAHWEASADL